MLPKDTITYTLHIPSQGQGEYIITQNKPLTILGASFTQSGISSETKLVCGTSEIFDNFAKDISYFEANIICNDVFKIVKTGNDEAMILVNYIPYVDTATTTNKSFTYGEILTNYFLFIIMVACVFGFIINHFIKRK